MADEGDAVKKFRDLTGTDENNARAYLEAANQDLEIALTHFFSEDSDHENSSDSKPAADQKPMPSKPPKSRFGTVAGLNRFSSSDSEEEGESQAFYAGGSTHSGQQVLGPRAQPANEIVNEMFRSAKEHGAQVLNQSEAGSSKQSTFKFTGAGYKLGQTSTDSQVVSGDNSGRQRQEMIIKLKLWRQGFSIDDGPLRKYSDSANVMFLKTVSRGEIPDELLRQAQGNEVQLSMEDHSHEEFNQVKPKLKAFSGKGNVLGSPVPGDAASIPASTPAENRGECEARARATVQVDSTLPTTSVQIRLADGSRLIATLNHTHTIADLRNFIITARPEYASVSFNLLTSFPLKLLSEETSTLAEAQILSASVLQRLA